ncbi:MAG: hypothetical protein WCH42_01680 [Actinomycetes bacterium]
MKRHLAILAFGLLVAGSVTYAQLTPQAVTNSASSSISQSTAPAASTNTSVAPAAPISSITKPSIAGGGESDD